VSASATLRVDPNVRDRLAALAQAQGIDPSELVAQLVLQAETAQVVAEVNRELERLSQGPAANERQRDELRELEATVTSWMRD
jgi:predicted transcriptional regulator